ncbi:ABC transporter [Phytophthora megakarya]|uniref:ABC transporter n=1 Tax=Phytophthora megakarya TaxID=4795 RepID=A0A225VQM3_9STRA|nr:ABC transporter [Phytophthora megakarya]
MSKCVEEKLSRGTPEENKAALEAAQALFAHYPDVVIRQLVLENCQDTIVGNGMMRSVSGGELKRVTTGEMEFGMTYVTLMDEISTGLDSAATYDIIKTQRSIAKKLQKTVVIALLHPAPEVFELFGDVIILIEGKVMYHGPREHVVDHFDRRGFKCPPERDVAGYLLGLVMNQQYQYEAALPSGLVPPPAPGERHYRISTIYCDMLVALEAPYDPKLLENVSNGIDPMREFHHSF